MLKSKLLTEGNFNFGYCLKSKTAAFGKKLIARIFKSEEGAEPALVEESFPHY